MEQNLNRSRMNMALNAKCGVSALLVFTISSALFAQQTVPTQESDDREAMVFDDPFTDKVNEGYIGSGFDDPFTPDVNEGYIGSGFDDPSTPMINEGLAGSGFDDPETEEVNEGAIGSGFDDPLTPVINEGEADPE